MMHHQQWPFRPENSTYVENDDDEDDFDVDRRDYSASRRYLTMQPKQWCTSYLPNRQHYVHSTDSAVNHNGGIGGGPDIGIENDIYSGIGGRTTSDFFRSKTIPRRTTAAAMMDDFDGGEDATTTGGPRTGNHQWATSADIVEYDSSTAANTPTLQQHQQQHTQLLLPQQQQRSYKFPQKAGAAHAANSTVSYGDKAAAIVSATAAQESANGRATAMKWKTRALYAFLACLLAVVVINLTLTLWFIRVTQFTSEGMGSMKITHGGLRLSGRTLVTDRLIASVIRSRAGRPLLIESTANVTLNARNANGRLLNSLKLTKDGLECAQANEFRVTNTRGETLFSADQTKVIIGTQELRVTGSGGAVFQGSVQTPMVQADARHDLRLESASRKLELSGPQGVTIESRAGDITASCLMDVKLQSIAGAIQIDAAKVFFKGLKTFKTSTRGFADGAVGAENGGHQNSIGAAPQPSSSSSRKRGVEDKLPSVYQLCVCGNGKVFMSPPDGQCAADIESSVCQ